MNKNKNTKIIIIVLVFAICLAVVAYLFYFSEGESILKRNENDAKEFNPKVLLGASRDWSAIPIRENNLVLYSSIKAPITIETFEKNMTDCVVGINHVSPADLGEYTGIGSNIEIELQSKYKVKLIILDEDVRGIGIDICNNNFIIEVKDIDYKERNILGKEGNESDFSFLLERYGRPSKVVYFDGVNDIVNYYWEREDYYFGVVCYIADKTSRVNQANEIIPFSFHYIPREAWASYINDFYFEDYSAKMPKDKMKLVDFDELCEIKSKERVVEEDDSDYYVKNIYEEDNVKVFNDKSYKDDNYAYEITEKGYYRIYDYLGKEREITIPNEANGKEVKEVQLVVTSEVEKINISGEWKEVRFYGKNIKEISYGEDTFIDCVYADMYNTCDSLNYYYFPKCNELTGEFFYFMNKNVKDKEEFHVYFNSCETIGERVFINPPKSLPNIIFHVRNNHALYDKLSSMGYNVVEEK